LGLFYWESQFVTRGCKQENRSCISSSHVWENPITILAKFRGIELNGKVTLFRDFKGSNSHRVVQGC
jgi:hypothetical protein